MFLVTYGSLPMAGLPMPRRALIVEDEPFVALDLKDALLALGFDVCGVALNQQRARALAANAEPDIAVMDICLESGREGIEVARWLREVCRVHVVFVTPNADKATLERIQEQLPGAPVLSKPVSPRRLADAVAVL